LKKGDELLVKTRQGTFVYVITKTWVTKPDDRTVIVPYGKPVLTLTTCYPFTYIGPAPERYIIQSELKEKIDGSSVTTRGG
jgi:sortase A